MRCRACNCVVDFGEEYCYECETVIWEYNIDLHIGDDDELDIPPSGDDWDRDEV